MEQILLKFTNRYIFLVLLVVIAFSSGVFFYMKDIYHQTDVLDKAHEEFERENFSLAREYYLPLAKEGNSSAILGMAYTFAFSSHDQQSIDLAVGWLKKYPENSFKDCDKSVPVSSVLAMQLSFKLSGHDSIKSKKWHEIAYLMGFDPTKCKI